MKVTVAVEPVPDNAAVTDVNTVPYVELVPFELTNKQTENEHEV